MKIEQVHASANAAPLASPSAQAFLPESSSHLNCHADVQSLIDRLRAVDSYRALLAWDGDQLIGWLGIAIWDAGYATLHPISGGTVG